MTKHTDTEYPDSADVGNPQLVRPPKLTEAGAMAKIPAQVWVLRYRNGCEHCHGATWLEVTTGRVYCGGHWGDDKSPCDRDFAEDPAALAQVRAILNAPQLAIDEILALPIDSRMAAVVAVLASYGLAGDGAQ